MILVLRHEPFEHLGHFADALDAQSVSYIYHDLHDPIQPQEHSRVIIMGGPMSANDTFPELAAELRLIERALSTGVPMLGICLGSQLIAKALGARVYRNATSEIGWAPVHLTEAGQEDPLFRGIVSPATFFHWHSETFDLPSRAEWLAYSERCRHQAYRYGRNVYGLQFHPEITAEMIADWCTQPVNCGDVTNLEAPIDPTAENSAHAARQILNAWLLT
jgi:GMP synthase (glutamine-hydrolysing)